MAFQEILPLNPIADGSVIQPDVPTSGELEKELCWIEYRIFMTQVNQMYDYCYQSFLKLEVVPPELKFNYENFATFEGVSKHLKNILLFLLNSPESPFYFIKLQENGEPFMQGFFRKRGVFWLSGHVDAAKIKKNSFQTFKENFSKFCEKLSTQA